MSADSGPVFVDTNILLYAYDLTAGRKHESGKSVVAELGRARLGVLSVQVLQEFFVNATLKLPRPLKPADAKKRIEKLALWRVHAPGATDVLAAVDIARRHSISFWDAMIVRSASASGCRVLWTEDLSPDQVYEGVRVTNPLT